MKQFGRQIRLFLGNASESIECSQLRISFEVVKTITSEPNPARIRIMNLNPSHRNEITSGNFDTVILSVGYEDMRVIYAGDIVHCQDIREGLDTVTELECGDGAQDITFARVNTTLSAGADDRTILTETLKSMGKTHQSVIDLPNARALPRGKVLVGNARDVIEKVSVNNDANWSVQDGGLLVLPQDKALADNEGYVISKDSGMIGSPQRTQDGMKLTCYLNPALVIGSLIRVESILKAYNGDYKITELTHTGDYLTDSWFSEIVCIGGEFQKVNR